MNDRERGAEITLLLLFLLISVIYRNDLGKRLGGRSNNE